MRLLFLGGQCRRNCFYYIYTEQFPDFFFVFLSSTSVNVRCFLQINRKMDKEVNKTNISWLLIFTFRKCSQFKTKATIDFVVSRPLIIPLFCM